MGKLAHNNQLILKNSLAFEDSGGGGGTFDKGHHGGTVVCKGEIVFRQCRVHEVSCHGRQRMDTVLSA